MSNLTTNEKRIYLSSPHLSGNEEKYVKEAFSTNWVAPLGPNVDAFEKELANYVGAKYATATSSGTAALHLALKVVGVDKGDFVFCSTLTFVASANPIIYSGGTPVFIDSEPETWNMSSIALERAFKFHERIGKMPKAVVVVNLYGQSADYDQILSICNKYNVPVIEDAAESLGSTYREKPSGTLGKYGVFSFNGNKIITTSGGGMLISNDKVGIEKAKFLATQAKEPEIHYEHKEVGFNYRLSNVLAGVGRGQLELLDDRVKKRREIFQRYQKELSFEGFNFMCEAEYGKHNRWLTTLTIDDEKTGFNRTELIQELEQKNIEARPVWKPLHLQPTFRNIGCFSHENNKFISEELFEKGICLPSGSNMTFEDQDRVIEVINDMVKKRVR
ncbi:aminotransferase class I/II-fold pyridoxal phosphate-dependent enzyme [Shouchella clausii]